MSRTRVKICGITNERDAMSAVAAGADALGFNTWAGSKRHIDIDAAGEWIGRLPALVARVAVLVNAPLDEALRIARLPFIDMVQFHGDEDADYCAEFARSGMPFIKAMQLKAGDNPAMCGNFSTPNILLDAHVPGQYGGTGRQADWTLAARFVAANRSLNVILAGGLSPENVADAIRAVRPFAVDVAGGVEFSPGCKDAGKVENFIVQSGRAG
jgi:phosphoribosylanthranilate isomerase